MKWCTKLWKALDKIILEMVGVVCDTGFYFKSRKKVLKCVSIRSLAMAFFLVDGENQLLEYFLIAYDASGCVYQPHRRNYLLFMLWILSFPQTFPLGLGDGQFYAWTDGLRRKDWHDYGSMQKEAMRSGMEFSVSQVLLCFVTYSISH